MLARLGPGGWPCHSILGWGAPMVFMGDVAGGSAIVPRREGGTAHTHNLSSPSRKIADEAPQEPSFSFFGELPSPSFLSGMGGTPPISKALRCGGGAALLLRKEWRAA